MKWFGESWGAPVCTHNDHVETPIGRKCGYCDKVIAKDDTGLELPFSGAANDPPTLPYHIGCFMRSVGLGGSVHILQSGYPLCRFSVALPRDWPDGHKWVHLANASEATCPECKLKARELVS